MQGDFWEWVTRAAVPALYSQTKYNDMTRKKSYEVGSRFTAA